MATKPKAKKKATTITRAKQIENALDALVSQIDHPQHLDTAPIEKHAATAALQWIASWNCMADARAALARK